VSSTVITAKPTSVPYCAGCVRDRTRPQVIGRDTRSGKQHRPGHTKHPRRIELVSRLYRIVNVQYRQHTTDGRSFMSNLCMQPGSNLSRHHQTKANSHGSLVQRNYQVQPVTSRSEYHWLALEDPPTMTPATSNVPQQHFGQQIPSMIANCSKSRYPARTARCATTLVRECPGHCRINAATVWVTDH
jgi:hypothetical protein